MAARRHHALLTLLVSAAAMGSVAAPSFAKSYVFPHVLETSGKITDTQNTFDTQFFMTYGGGLAGTPGTGANVDLYVFDNSGLPMRSGTGLDVCNPCTYPIGTGGPGSAGRKRTLVLDDLITDKGGFAGGGVTGFAIADVTGDADNVTLQGFVVNSHTSAFDLSTAELPWHEDDGCDEPSTSKRVFVVPHVLEQSGKISNTQFTFDTSIFATYTPGLGPIPPGTGAVASFYLYDDSGAPMVGLGGGDVCNPCMYDLDSSHRKQSIQIDDLITAAGGFDAAVKLGFGVIVVGGSNPEGVNIQGFVVNAHTSPFDVSVFGFDPVPLQGAAVAVEPDLRGFVTTLSGRPNPSRGDVSFSFELARPGRVELGIFDAQGRKVATVMEGQLEAGGHAATWSGLDASGARVTAGYYFARLHGSDGSKVSRLVVVP